MIGPSSLRLFATAGAVLAAALSNSAIGDAGVVPARGLTGAPQLALAYDAIFDAQFAEVPARLAQACALRAPQGAPSVSTGPSTSLGAGAAPEEACHVLEAVALWWRIQLDPLNRTHDAAFQSKVETAIAAAAALTEREPERAEAWFFLGGAYGARVQWRVLRGERLAAARDGKRIKEALERALALDPSLEDAHFGIGLYHYYADVAPAAAKILRWLLLLPGGDRARGLQEMERARRTGQVLGSEADYQLHLVYLWYEKQPERALDLLAALRRRHPNNPHFLQSAAEIQDVYLHNAAASLQSWEALLTAARNRTSAEPEMAETVARLGIASQLQRLGRTESALEHLRAVIAAQPRAPFGASARAHLQLGDALARLGRRTDAAAEYRAAISATTGTDPLGIRASARTKLRTLGS